MFRHVVMFTFKDGTSESQIQAALDGLDELRRTIPGIHRYTFGRDAGVNAGNYEIAIVGDFLSKNDYIGYRDHPSHQRFVKEVMAPIIDKRAALQFETS